MLFIDISEHRLSVAKTMGANVIVTVDPKLDARAMADKIVSLMGSAPDVTIECSGAETSLQTGICVSGSVMTQSPTCRL